MSEKDDSVLPADSTSSQSDSLPLNILTHLIVPLEVFMPIRKKFSLLSNIWYLLLILTVELKKLLTL